jgi:hypothetical protein
VARRALPALLALIALSADVSGGHGVALAFVLLAIPAAFGLMLDCYGDALEARCGGMRPLLAAGSLVLLVLSAALRSPAVVGGVPRLAVSAIAFCLVLYGSAFLGALLTVKTTEPEIIETSEEQLAA